MGDFLFMDQESLSENWSGFTGKPTSESTQAAADAAMEASKWETEMSKSYYSNTSSMREKLITQLTDTLSGNYDATSNPQYASAKKSAEQTYQTGMDELMSSTPAGGALYEGMADLQGSKADTLTDAISSIYSDMYNKAYSMGQGSQSVAASGAAQSGETATDLLSGLASQSQAGASASGNYIKLAQLLAELYGG